MALPEITTEDGLLEFIAEQAEQAAWNIAKQYNYMSTDANTTRIVDVPVTALYYGQLAKIGGNTIAESDELLSAEVTSVNSKSAAGKILQTYSIPAEVQALEGYGWSAGSAYNYVDFERKVFAKNVGKVVLDGTQSIGLVNWAAREDSSAWAYYSSVIPSKPAPHIGAKANLICAELPTVTYANIAGNSVGIANGDSATYGLFVRVADTSLTTASAINAYLSANPITVYYELATPVEVDISEFLVGTDIKVNAGGTLTFENENGLDVPSEVKYMK